MFPTFSDTGRQSGQFFRPVCVSVPGICFRPWPSSPRLYLPSCNASVWSHARRTQRVRSAEAKRGAFVPVERHLLRRTERAERVQNTPDPPQTSISISVHERESSDVIRGSSSSSSSSSSGAGYFLWFVSG